LVSTNRSARHNTPNGHKLCTVEEKGSSAHVGVILEIRNWGRNFKMKSGSI
jgi:hypothetical protein